MYLLTIHYPNSPEATFDFDYFRTTHLPQIGKAFKPFGLGYANVLRGEQAVGGGDPAFFAITTLSFATEEGARNAIASADGRALAADFQNFTNVTPVMQFSTAVP